MADKNLIYQVAVGPKSKLYEHCIESVARYAERIGAEHIVQRKPILRINPNPFTSNRSEGAARLGYLPIYEKENAFDLLPDYDNVAIIDSDIYIRGTAPDIFPELNGKEFGAVCEREMPITDQYASKIKNYSHMQYHNLHNPKKLSTMDFKPNAFGYEFYNMGMMLMNKSFHKHINMPAKKWLEKAEFQGFIDGRGAWKWSTDQTLLNYVMKRSIVDVQHLDYRWNALYKGVRGDKIKDAHFVHFFLKDKLPDRGENVEQLMKDIEE